VKQHAFIVRLQKHGTTQVSVATKAPKLDNSRQRRHHLKIQRRLPARLPPTKMQKEIKKNQQKPATHSNFFISRVIAASWCFFFAGFLVFTSLRYNKTQILRKEFTALRNQVIWFRE